MKGPLSFWLCNNVSAMSLLEMKTSAHKLLPYTAPAHHPTATVKVRDSLESYRLWKWIRHRVSKAAFLAYIRGFFFQTIKCLTQRVGSWKESQPQSLESLLMAEGLQRTLKCPWSDCVSQWGTEDRFIKLDLPQSPSLSHWCDCNCFSVQIWLLRLMQFVIRCSSHGEGLKSTSD